MDIPYKEIYAMNKEEARKQVVDTYFTVGSISQVVLADHIGNTGLGILASSLSIYSTGAR